MNILCERGSRKNNIKGSVITITASTGEVVDRIPVPSYYGIEYCKDHPTGKVGQRYKKAIEIAQGKRPAKSLDSHTWKGIDYLNPPKSGNYWFSDGKNVWCATVSTPAQVKSMMKMEGARFYQPIGEKMPNLNTIYS